MEKATKEAALQKAKKLMAASRVIHYSFIFYPFSLPLPPYVILRMETCERKAT